MVLFRCTVLSAFNINYILFGLDLAESRWLKADGLVVDGSVVDGCIAFRLKVNG